MKKYLTEFIGTFFLVLTIGCVVILGGTGSIPPLAIGSVLMVMVYAGGHVSGAHYNPAVTLAIWIRGRCPTQDLIPYWLSQIIGAACAAAAVGFWKGSIPVSAISVSVGPALLAEFLFTFALVYVVLNVATAKSTSGNSYYGLAIGFTVLAGAFAVGSISGAAFNPAVIVGASLMGLSPWPNIWIYLVAELSAALVAALTFKLINPEDK